MPWFPCLELPQPMRYKGIILAGGSGSRLYPVTISVNKQLMPVYDKPMIYYPLTTLMQSEIRDLLIITTPRDADAFYALLGNGSQWGLNISYAVQEKPEGLAQAFIIGEEFIGDDCSCLILGDNIFYGSGLPTRLLTAAGRQQGATVFASYVNNPQDYGVITFNDGGTAVDIEEKPTNPLSSYAVTGLYYFDNQVVEMAKQLKFSRRGELEITDINNNYLRQGKLNVEILPRGTAWLDTGTHNSLLDAAQFIHVLEERQGLKVSCPEETAFYLGWISRAELVALAEPLLPSGYGNYLMKVAEGSEEPNGRHAGTGN